MLPAELEAKPRIMHKGRMLASMGLIAPTTEHERGHVSNGR
jgi:hypothetical protein